jgi:23S rRNA (uracil1939-C5)-methyltransferase
MDAMEEPLRLTLTNYAYGGEAFARDDSGRVVFVPFSMTGETVDVEIREAHKRWARAGLPTVIEPSPQRTIPPCKHFGLCGGCHYQHMSYAAQLQAKTQIVVDQLTRLGGLEAPTVLEAIPCPDPWRYRSRLSLHISPEGRLGYVTAAGDQVFAIDECHLASPAVDELWRSLDIEALEGVVRVDVQSDDAGGNMIVFYANVPPQQELEIGIQASLVWVTPEASWILAGGEPLTFAVSDREFQVSAGSFFQVNRHLTPVLVERALSYLEIESGETAFDLYAGVGLFSAFAATRGAAVVAVENSATACLDFEANLENFEGVELFESTVAQALPAIERHPDAVIADPPRSGLGSEVVNAIVDKAPERLVYVSCDPATFARDAGGLASGGYSLVECVPIDLFPQTYHIETVSVWRPA